MADDPRTELTLDQIERWAARIAEGRDAFPTDGPAATNERLATAVRSRLRTRLRHYIARAIAMEIDRRRKEIPEHGGPNQCL